MLQFELFYKINNIIIVMCLYPKELVLHYEQNTLSSIFPWIKTKLLYPYLAITKRRLSKDSTPVSASTQGSVCWVKVRFNFIAEYPDELTINVCAYNIYVLSLSLSLSLFFSLFNNESYLLNYFRKMNGWKY